MASNACEVSGEGTYGGEPEREKSLADAEDHGLWKGLKFGGGRKAEGLGGRSFERCAVPGGGTTKSSWGNGTVYQYVHIRRTVESV